MPELPEVESIRRTLLPRILDQKIWQVRIHRADVVHSGVHLPSLLLGQPITTIKRLGKQLALVSANERCICIHLGMSGALTCGPAKRALLPHTHVVWSIEDQELRFRDPRRFGGIWPFINVETLHHQRWNSLGPDALTIKPNSLLYQLLQTTRPLKTVLLDQGILAGLGNIYVDELLYLCKIHPLQQANALGLTEVSVLIIKMRQLLKRAIRTGGSTLRDYVDGEGQPGRYQKQHCVYGRAGKSCLRCQRKLNIMQISGRSTVWCGTCQGRRILKSSS